MSKPKRGFPDKKTQMKYQHLELRIQAFEHYGGCKCACCGETDPVFLGLDHIKSDGAAQRRKMSATGRNWGWGGHHLYRPLRSQGYPPGFQVPFMNCNFGGAHNNGVCPHIAPSKPLKERLAELEALRGASSLGNLFRD